jgi:hypothetical protein
MQIVRTTTTADSIFKLEHAYVVMPMFKLSCVSNRL